jgi:iron complex outermembrane recepter protein
MKNSTMTSRAALSVFALFAAGSLPAQQTEPPKKEDVVQLEAFVATGTRFNDRTVTESPVPIDVIPSAELRQGGYTETSQMIQALVPSFNFPRITVGDGSDHIRPAMLRGLAPDQTLVLVNGKRRHTSSLVNVNGFVGRGSVSIDFNAIPASAIGRIEVLRDGASAQYGSDAIAGVINVILAKDTGWKADFQWGQTSEGDGRVLDFNVAGGFKTEADGSIFLSAFWRDREQTNRSKPDTRQQYFGTNTTTGALTTLNGNFGSGFVATANNGTTVAAAPSTAFTLNAAEQTINRRNHRQGDGDSEDKGLFVNGDLRTGDATFYYFGGYTTRDGQAAGFWRRPGDDRTVRAIYPNGFLPLINSDIVDYSLGGGFKGDTGKLSWDFSTVYGSNQFDFVISNSANVTLGANSKRTFDAGGLGFEQWTTNLDFTTSFGSGENPLKVAFGAEYRWEGYEITPGEPDSYRDGGIRILDGPNAGGLGAVGAQVFPGFRPSDAIDADRNSYALYVDAERNFTENLLVSAAVRFEDYSDFGNETTFKLAGRFAVNDALAFRASASTGFRAPHLAQQWFSSTATNFIGGVPFENKTFPVNDPVARLLGARPLKAETSTNLSVGATFSRAGFAASIDFYQVEIDDRIVLSSNFSGGPIGPFLAANGQGQANGGRYFTNAVDTETKGVDINLRYTWEPEGLGKLTATAGVNFNQTDATRISATPSQLTALGVVTPLFDIVEKVRMEDGQPKNVFNIGLNWVFNDFTVFLRNVRYGAVSAAQSDASGWIAARNAALSPGFDIELVSPAPGAPAGNMVPVQTFSAKWLTDLDVTYRYDDRTTFSLGANNLFDVYPDQNIASTSQWLGSDNAGIFPYSGISPFGFNGRFYYGKISYKW